MSNNKRHFLAVLAAALVLVGCGPNLTSGKVVDRSYDDPDDWSTWDCQMYGKNGCVFWGWTEHHDGPHWSLTIEATVDGEVVRDDVEVTEHIHSTCRDGWHYPDCTPR